MIQSTIPRELLENMRTQDGTSLAEYAAAKPVLLVFLRHFGCTFCREALKDVSSLQDEIEKQGVQLVFVHLSDENTAKLFFEKNDLGHLPRISDPEAQYYKAFGLVKGTFKQLLGLQVWIRGFQSAVMEQNSLSLPLGDGFQMPGIFILEGNRVVERYIHKFASDRPDYLQLISCCNPDAVEVQ